VRAVFLWLCGLFMITGATCILLGFPEQLVAVPPVSAGVGDDGGGAFLSHLAGSTSVEGVDMIADKYSKLADVCSLPSVQALILCLITMQVLLSSKQEAFEKCWAHLHCEPPHAARFTLPFTRCRYCRTPPAHQCP